MIPTPNTHNSTRKRRSASFRRPRTADEFFALPEQFQSDWDKSSRVISKMRADELSLRKAANQENINPQTVTRLAGRALKKRRNGSYAVTKTDSLLRVMKVITPQGPTEIEIRNSQAASVLGQYWDAIDKDSRGERSALSTFQGKVVRDANGHRYPLIIDQAELQRLRSAGVLSFESIYARVA